LAIRIDAEATMKAPQDPVALTTLICQLVLGAMGATAEAWKRVLVEKPLLLLNSMLLAQRFTEAAEVVTRLPEPRETYASRWSGKVTCGYHTNSGSSSRF
jgi:hypothetical protein